MKNTLKQALVAFGVGIVFAIGLGVSGMTQPQRVIGFLRVIKNWDMTLVFVMVGAIGVHAIAYLVKRKMRGPVFDSQWHVPTSQIIDRKLVGGAILFGIGWGLAGYCPGPALVAVSQLNSDVLTFVTTMVVSMMAYNAFAKKTT